MPVQIYSAPIQLATFAKRFDTASQPFVLSDWGGTSYSVKFAERAENGTRGLAREYLVGSLAELMDAPAASSTLVELTSGFLAMEPRLAFSDGSRPAPQITVGLNYFDTLGDTVDPALLPSTPVLDAASILVFNTWVAAGDRHWGNYVMHTDERGNVRLASVDYASSLMAQPGTAPQVMDAAELLAWIRSAPQMLLGAIERLERIPGRLIERAVERVPSGWIDQAERRSVADYLLGSQPRVRLAIKPIFA